MNAPVNTPAAETAWQIFSGHGAAADFPGAWLSIQCEMVRGARAGWLYEPAPEWRRPRLLARTGIALGEQTTRVVEALAAEGGAQAQGLMEELADGSGFLTAYPIVADRAAVAVVVVAVGRLQPDALAAAMRQLQWGSGWFLDWSRRGRPKEVAIGSSEATDVFKLFAATIEPEGFASAATALTTRLAHLWQLERASIGMQRGPRVRLAAVSHAADATARMAIVRRLEEAMHEAMDQRAAIILPNPGRDQGLVTHAAAALLAHGTDAGALAVLPLMANGSAVGAVLLEKATPFTESEIRRADALTALLGPVLLAKRLNDRLLITKIGSSIVEQLQKLFGAGHPIRKAVAAALVVLILVASIFNGAYSVSAPAVIEAEARRIVPAPFDGYLAQSIARPGDKVKAGDVLASLDQSDLTLERLGLLADREQRNSEFQQATAKYELAKAKMLKAEIDQISAKLSLVDMRLERSRLRAPFDGIVLTGDLSQSIGEPVKTGAPLFELAPAGEFRLVAKVSEQDIDAIRVGQQGRAVLAALPESTFEFEVVRVTPVLEAKGGRNYYRVEARLAAMNDALRPGLEGRARIDAGERRLLWIWTHQLLAWARLQIWAWLP